MTLRPEILDELLKDYKNPLISFGSGRHLEATDQSVNRTLFNCRIGYAPRIRENAIIEAEEEKPRNRRNGHSKKKKN
ncbi:MAG: hypothetical protein N5P05_004335 (plasmid) [Chroococcopsis gigantea SAG 12.99]|nr:hypothetical protein [Chroococcopsis gigantea SAG 12.99]